MNTWTTWSYLVDTPAGLALVALLCFWVAVDRTLARREHDERRDEPSTNRTEQVDP